MQHTYGQQFAEIYDDVFPAGTGPRRGARFQRTGDGARARRGTGRVAIPLAQRGISVTGVDLSAEMLDRCRDGAVEAGVDLDLVQGSMTDLRLGQRFDLVFCVCASISMLLTREHQRETLATARDHLADGGRLVVETHNPDAVPRPARRTSS